MPGDVGEGWVTRVVLIGLAVAVMGVLVGLPLALVFQMAVSAGLPVLWAALSEPDAVASIRLTLLVAVIVVPLNTLFGLCAAWCLTRHRFWGRRVLLPLLGLPFSVSPIVAGLLFVLLFGSTGWFGPSVMGMPVLFAVPGLVLATAFVTVPYVAAQLIPVLAAAGPEAEEAALTLGANGWQLFWFITLPQLRWPLLQGVLLCNARAMGEFGAVAVVSGRIAGATNTMPLQVEALYNQYNLAGAFSVAALLAMLALVTMMLRAIVDWLQDRTAARGQAAVLVQAA